MANTPDSTAPTALDVIWQQPTTAAPASVPAPDQTLESIWAPVKEKPGALDAIWANTPPDTFGTIGNRPNPIPVPSAQTAPLIPSDASISANTPTVWDRIKDVFTSGDPNYSSRTSSNSKYGQTQLITPEAALAPEQQRAHPVVTGLGELAGGLTTPDSAAALAASGGISELPGAARIIPKLISMGFGLNAIRQAISVAPESLDAFKAGDTPEAERLATHAIGDIILGGFAIAHGATATGRPGIMDEEVPAEEQAPAGKTAKGKTAQTVEPTVEQSLQNANEVKTVPIAPYSPAAEVVKNPETVPDVRLTSSDAVKLALTKDDTVLPGTDTSNPVMKDSFVPIVTKPEILNAVVQQMITEHGLQEAGIDPEKIESRGDVAKMLNDAADHIGKNLDPRVGSVIGFEAQKSLAAELNMSVTDLMQRTGGTAYSAEQALAARSLLKASTTDVMNKALLAATGDETKLTDFTKALAQNKMIQDQVQGITSEAGRALGSFNIKEPALPEVKIVDMLSQLSQDAQKKAAQLLAKTDISNPKAVNDFIEKIKPSSTADQVFEYYRNALLSGGSVVTKTLSEAGAIALTSLQKGIAGGLSALSEIWNPNPDVMGAPPTAATGEVVGESNRQYASEGYFYGRGVLRALPLALKSALTGELNLEDSPDFERTNTQAIKGPLGDVVRFPSTLLSRLTNAVYQMNYEGELASQAARIALREGLSGDEAQARMSFLLNEPTDAMRDAADAMGRKNTFQQDLGKFGTSLQNVIKNDPTGLSKYIFPFTKVPQNLVKQGVYWSPVSVFKGIAAGNNDQVAAGAIGTALALGIVTGVLDGRISGGGPISWKANQALQATGWQPYSLKVGDRWVSYKKLNPVSLAMSLTADAVHSIHAGTDDPEVSQNKADAAVGHIIRNVKDFPFLMGLSSVVEMLDDSSGKKVNNFIDRTIAAFIPSGLAEAAKTIDTTVRHPEGLAQTLESRIPGQTDKVPPSIGPDGEPLTRPRNALGGFSPVPVTTMKHDDAFDELSRLGLSGVQVPKLAPMKHKVDGKEKEAPNSTPSADEALALQKQESAKFYQAFSRAITHEKWDNLSDPDKAKVVEDLKRKIAADRLHRLRQLQAAE